MVNDFRGFEQELQRQLRARPPGTLARLSPDAGAYWNGQEVKGIFIGRDDDGSDDLDEEFDLEFAWTNWPSDLAAWVAAPRFEDRLIISEWIEQRIA